MGIMSQVNGRVEYLGDSDILRTGWRYVVYQVFIRCVFEHGRVGARALAPSPLSLTPSLSVSLHLSSVL